MTARYQLYLTALAERDQTLVLLTIIALSLVAAWISLDYFSWLPKKFVDRLKGFYMVGGIGLYLFTLILSTIEWVKKVYL